MPSAPSNPAIYDEDEDLTTLPPPVQPRARTVISPPTNTGVQTPAPKPAEIGSTGGMVPTQGELGGAQPAAPTAYSQDPAERQRQARQVVDANFRKQQEASRPFTPSGSLAQPGSLPEGFYQAGERNADESAMNDRRAEVARRRQANAQTAELRKTKNATLEAEMRGTGQKFYTDAFGDIQPVIEAGTNRPMYDETPWEDGGVHPESGEPTLIKRDKYGQRQYKAPQLTVGTEPTDDQLYYKFGDDDLRPAGSMIELTKHANPKIARMALAANKRRIEATHREALAGVKAVADGAKLELESAKENIAQVQGAIEQLMTQAASIPPEMLTQTAGGVLGIGASPTPQALAAQQQKAQLEAEAARLNAEMETMKADIKPGGRLARAQTQSAVGLKIATATAVRDTFAAQEAEILKRLEDEGGTPEKDPLYLSNKRNLDNATAVLQQATREQDRFNQVFNQQAPAAAPVSPDQEVSTVGGVINTAARAGRQSMAALNVLGAGNRLAKRDEYLASAARAEQQAATLPRGRLRDATLKTVETLRARAAAMGESAGGELTAAGQQLEKAGALKGTKVYEDYSAATGADALKQFLANPVEIAINIAGEGAAGSLPTLAAGAAGAAVAGPAGLAAGTGIGSFATEYASTLLSVFGDAGIDPNDGAAMAAGFSDPAIMEEVKTRGLARGIPVAAFDALSGGLAGRVVAPALKSGVKGVVKAGGREVLEQAAAGAGGETLGQVSEQIAMTGDVTDLSVKDIAAEAIGEIVPGAGQTAIGAALRARKPGVTPQEGGGNPMVPPGGALPPANDTGIPGSDRPAGPITGAPLTPDQQAADELLQQRLRDEPKSAESSARVFEPAAFDDTAAAPADERSVLIRDRDSSENVEVPVRREEPPAGEPGHAKGLPPANPAAESALTFRDEASERRALATSEEGAQALVDELQEVTGRKREEILATRAGKDVGQWAEELQSEIEYRRSPLTVDPDRRSTELRGELEKLDREWEAHVKRVGIEAEMAANAEREGKSASDVFNANAQAARDRHELLMARREAIETGLTELERSRQSPASAEGLRGELETEGQAAAAAARRLRTPELEARRDAIEDQLTDAERLRQSDRGAQLLAEELVQEEARTTSDETQAENQIPPPDADGPGPAAIVPTGPDAPTPPQGASPAAPAEIAVDFDDTPSSAEIAYNSILEKQGKAAADEWKTKQARAGEWRPSANVGISPPSPASRAAVSTPSAREESAAPVDISKTKPADAAKLSPSAFLEFYQSVNKAGTDRSMTGDAHEFGREHTTPAQIEDLKQMRDTARELTRIAMENGSEDAIGLSYKGQYFAEAYDIATKTGTYDTVRDVAAKIEAAKQVPVQSQPVTAPAEENPLKRMQESSKNRPLTPDEIYDESRFEFKAAAREFRKAQEAFRAKTIDAGAFLEARKKMDAAQTAADVAESAYIDAKNAAGEKRPEPRKPGLEATLPTAKKPASKRDSIVKILGPRPEAPGDYHARAKWDARMKEYAKLTAAELEEKVLQMDVNAERDARIDERAKTLNDEVAAALPKSTGGTWRKDLLEMAKREGIETFNPPDTSTRGEAIYNLAQRLAEREINGTRIMNAPLQPAPATETKEAQIDRQIETLEYRMKQDKQRAITKPEDVKRLAELKATRAKDFPTSGNYEIEVGGKVRKFFRDPENKWWYEDKAGHHSGNVLSVTTKEDAIESLKAKYGAAAAPVVKPTADGQTVKATPATERAVSKMADPAQLNEQKKFLQAAIAEAQKKAPDDLGMTPKGEAMMKELEEKKNFYDVGKRLGLMDATLKQTDLAGVVRDTIINQEAEHVTIEVPGDGTFRVPNTKQALKAFGERIKSRMNKTTATLPSPFSDKIEPYSAKAPTAIPAIKRKPTTEDLTAAAEIAQSDDDDRFVLQRVFADDGFAVATSGIRMHIVAGGEGQTAAEIAKLEIPRSEAEAKEYAKKTPEERKKFDALPKTPAKYPNWQAVLPKWLKASGGKIRVDSSAPDKRAIVETGEAVKALNQALAVIDMDSSYPNVKVYTLGGGQLGFAASDPKTGLTYQSEGVTDAMLENPGEHAAAAVDPKMLREAMQAARLAGHERVTMYFDGQTNPVVTVGGNNFAAIAMPISLRGPTPTPPPAAKTQAEKNREAFEKDKEATRLKEVQATLNKRASAAYAAALRESGAEPTSHFAKRLQELVDNPTKFHETQEENNAKGITVGAKVTVNPEKPGQVKYDGIAVSAQANEIKVQSIKEGVVDGWTSIKRVEIRRDGKGPGTAAQVDPTPPTPAELPGAKIDSKWTAFGPDSKSLGIPRAQMPQIKSEHRGALAQFLAARGVRWKPTMADPTGLRPTQAEFSPAKVQQAREFEGNERPILVSQDGHIVDGHHQWMAALDDPGTPIPVIRLEAPIDKVLAEVAEFPSVEMAKDAAPAAKVAAAQPAEKKLSDRVIAALESAKIGKPGRVLSADPLSLAWDAAIDVAILAVRAGRTPIDAVDLAIRRYKAKHPKATPEDVAKLETRVREIVTPPPAPDDNSERKNSLFPESLKAAGVPAKSISYDTRGHEARRDEAAAILRREGRENGERLLRDPNIPGDTRVAIGGNLISGKMLELAGAAPGDVQKVTKDIRRIVSIMQPELATEAGQQISMFGGIYKDVRVSAGVEYMRNAEKETADALGGADATAAVDDAIAAVKGRDKVAAEKALEALKKKHSTKPAVKVIDAFKRKIDKVLELERIGALERDDMTDIAAAELGVKAGDPKKLKHIADIAEKIHGAKSHAERSRAELELADTLQIYKGISRMDVLSSLLTANVLSGYTTQAANIEGNFLQGFAQLATTAAVNPKNIGALIKGFTHGLPIGLQEAGSVLRTGRATRDFQDKTGGAGSTLQTVDFKREFGVPGAAGDALTLGARAVEKVFRFMKAADAVFYYPAREAYARLVTTKLLEGDYSGAELARKVDETLHITPEAFAAAKAQAVADGYTGIDLARRTADIIEENRRATEAGNAAVTQSEQFAAESTFTNEPVGLAGVAYHALKYAVEEGRLAKVPVLKPWLMFLKTPTNVFNAIGNWTPVGAMRAWHGMRGAGMRKPDRKNFTADERNRMFLQSAIGSAVMIGLLAGVIDDDKLDITATGPTSPGNRRQLQAAGWSPYTFRVGNRRISYKDSPLLIPLALMGHMADATRYQKSKTDLMFGSKKLDAALQAPRVIFETSMLTGLGELFSAANDGDMRGVTRTLSSIPANLVIPYNRLLQQIDQTFDTQSYQAPPVVGGVPFVRRAGRPKTDVQGRPEQYNPTRRFTTVESSDPVDVMLRSKNVFISEPGRDTKIGNTVMPDDVYEKYRTISGQRIRARLQIAAPAIRTMTQEKAQDEVRRITSEEREKTKAALRFSTTRTLSPSRN
jgi:hypothetical protein